MQVPKIIKYKTMVSILHVHTVRDGAKTTKDEIDNLLKSFAELEGSTKDIPDAKSSDLMESCYFLGSCLSCDLKDEIDEDKQPPENRIYLNFNR